MGILVSVIVTFLLVLINGYFSMSEMALVNAKQILLQKKMTLITELPLNFPVALPDFSSMMAEQTLL